MQVRILIFCHANKKPPEAAAQNIPVIAIFAGVKSDGIPSIFIPVCDAQFPSQIDVRPVKTSLAQSLRFK